MKLTITIDALNFESQGGTDNQRKLNNLFGDTIDTVLDTIRNERKFYNANKNAYGVVYTLDIKIEE